jgi:hypothetical protein
VHTALSVPDLLAGRIETDRLAGHGLVVIGLALLLVHRRVTRDGDGARQHPTVPDETRPGPPEPTEPDLLFDREIGGGLALSARRDAA